MWYLGKVASLCEQLGPVSTCLDVPNSLNFVFKIWEMAEKIETGVDRLILVLIIKKCSPKILLKINFFLFFKLKVVYLPVFIFSTNSQILKSESLLTFFIKAMGQTDHVPKIIC